MTQEFSTYPPSHDRAGLAPERFTRFTRFTRFSDDQHGDPVPMTHHADVMFLEALDSALIERNATEFARMRGLLASIDPSIIRAKDGTVWESAYRGHYDERLAEVRNLVVGLSAGFDKARVALFRYADEVKRAKQRLYAGVHAERKLDHLISAVTMPVTPAAPRAEPMRRWEDIRETAGFRNRVAELGMDPATIHDEATGAYNEAGDEFGRARSIERLAREVCLVGLTRAYGRLPDIRGEYRHAVAIIAGVVPLRAAARPDVWPPGRAVPDGGIPGGGAPADCHDFVAAYKELIDAVAHEFGLPPDLLAAIAWRELCATPHPLEALVEALRRAADGDWAWITAQSLPGSVAGATKGNTDPAGSMAAPIRRAAEVLGYDPASLNNGQFNEIESALGDPAQHVFIAAKYLARLKAESSFADVSADELTCAQYQELAARYAGGPYWSGGAAQSYGRNVVATLAGARAALRC
jgi:hypothetical protein